jgi:hypothetical protein
MACVLTYIFQLRISIQLDVLGPQSHVLLHASLLIQQTLHHLLRNQRCSALGGGGEGEGDAMEEKGVKLSVRVSASVNKGWGEGHNIRTQSRLPHSNEVSAGFTQATASIAQ